MILVYVLILLVFDDSLPKQEKTLNVKRQKSKEPKFGCYNVLGGWIFNILNS